LDIVYKQYNRKLGKEDLHESHKHTLETDAVFGGRKDWDGGLRS
jgi:hypothetical protein